MTDSQQNPLAGGWNAAMGVELVTVTLDLVVAEWTVGAQHKQPQGIVHGGVHSGVIETVCSVGGAINAAQHGQVVVGVENHTSFLKAVRQGRLRATATPISRGRRMQLWQAEVRDEQERLIATGRVRLFCLAMESQLAGEQAGKLEASGGGG